MLSDLYPFLNPAAIDPGLPDRLRSLADDCELLLRHRPVSPFTLLRAPRLDNWVVLQTPLGLRLAGNVSDHPLLGDRVAVTSPLWFANSGWVRTLSRFYLLESPARVVGRKEGVV